MTLEISAMRSSTKALSLATISFSARTSCMRLGSLVGRITRPSGQRQSRARHYSISLGAALPARKSDWPDGLDEQGREQPKREVRHRHQRPSDAQQRPFYPAVPLDEVHDDAERSEGQNRSTETRPIPAACQLFWRQAAHIAAHDPPSGQIVVGKQQSEDEKLVHRLRL